MCAFIEHGMLCVWRVCVLRVCVEFRFLLAMCVCIEHGILCVRASICAHVSRLAVCFTWGVVFLFFQFFRGSPRLKGRLIRDAMFKDGLHLLKSIFELPFPFD